MSARRPLRVAVRGPAAPRCAGGCAAGTQPGLDVHGCVESAAPALTPEDRDLIVQYLVLRALTRLQAGAAAGPADPAARAAPPRRRLRRHPRPRSRHGR